MDKIKKNYIFNLLYQIVTISVPLVTAPYLSRVLGANQIGKYSFAQSIIAYFVLFSALGTSLYGQRYIAGTLAKKQENAAPFLEILSIRVVGVILSAFVLSVLVYSGTNDKMLYYIASLELIAVAFDLSWFYQGQECFNILALTNGVAKIVGTVLIFILVKNENDLNIYVACYSGSILFGNILQWFFLKKYLRGKISGKLRVFRHILSSVKLLISQIAIQLYTVLDKTMIGLITKDDFQNGYYEQSQKIVKTLVAIITAMVAVMASRIAIIWNEKGENYKQTISELMSFSFRIVFCLAFPIMIGTIVISPRIVPLFFGIGYEPVVNMLRLLAVIIPIIGCSNIIGLQLLVPSNREKLFTKSVIVGSIVNVIANLILIPRYAAMGAIAASVVAESMVTLTQFLFARKELYMRKICVEAGRYLGYSLFMGLIGAVLSNKMSSSIWSLAMIVIICMVVYGGLLFIFRDPILKLFGTEKNSTVVSD